MKMFKQRFPIFALLATITFATFPLKGIALEITNAYVCTAQNAASAQARAYFRQQNGIAINLSLDNKFAVVCPVVVDYGDPSYDVAIRVGNADRFTKRISCQLEEYDGGGVKVKTIARSTSLPPNFTNSLIWENVRLASYNTGNYLSLRCVLPPLGYITSLGWD